jgi:hypothetical protein
MINNTLDKLWQIYINQNPSVKKIYDLFVNKGEQVINDHIAFRTFDLPKVNINRLAAIFQKGGYEMKGEYLFPEKKLYARHYANPQPEMPLIFISQLEMDSFSHEFKAEVQKIVESINQQDIDNDNFIHSGVLWKNLSYHTYNILRNESEYAAWLYTNGYVANHFTVSVNHLNSFNNLEHVNVFLKENGFTINANPSEIQGSKSQYLEQSSIKASIREVEFLEGRMSVPACYYEFALRHLQPDGKLFDSFIADSANKIFESTDVYSE